jgi:hypothetical protein
MPIKFTFNTVEQFTPDIFHTRKISCVKLKNHWFLNSSTAYIHAWPHACMTLRSGSTCSHGIIAQYFVPCLVVVPCVDAKRLDRRATRQSRLCTFYHNANINRNAQCKVKTMMQFWHTYVRVCMYIFQKKECLHVFA